MVAVNPEFIDPPMETIFAAARYPNKYGRNEPESQIDIGGF